MTSAAIGVTVLVLLLAVDVPVPLTIATLLAIRNRKVPSTAGREFGIWALTTGYLVIIGLIALSFFALSSTPQVEGLGTFSAMIVTLFVSLPGGAIVSFFSIIGLTVGAGASTSIPHLDIAFAVGVVCWSAVNAVGLRRISQIIAARRQSTSAGGETAHRAE